MPKTIDKKVTRAFAKDFMKGVEAGFGQLLSGIDYDTPDYEMLAHLQNNVYQFAGAKNYQQLKAVTQALVGEDGKLRTKSQFKKAAQQVIDTHERWRRDAEYNLAVAGGQMSSLWVEIQRQGADTMLEFDAVLDKRTTELCRSLNGVRKPARDPFWRKWYPPNHYGERSTVRILNGGRATRTEDIVYPDNLPAMFQVNLAERGLAFPPEHPYYDGLPAEVREDSLKLIPKAKRNGK